MTHVVLARALALLFFTSAALFAVPAIENAAYPSDAAARQEWKPMADTAPVALATVEGKKALRFPCLFTAPKVERASWDRAVKLDLAACEGIEFKLFCANARPVSYFSLYFQSGEGWYHAMFFPESSTAWNTLSIDKSSITTEGKPAGWDRISAIRVSAWRGQEADTEFYITDVQPTGVLGSDVRVAILRDESSARKGGDEAANVGRYGDSLANQFRAADVRCAILSDADLTPERLKGVKLVALPYNPRLADRAADTLISYVRGGGKLMIFYLVPDRLRGIAGVDVKGHVAASRSGAFSSMRFSEPLWPGMPGEVGQHSWNINEMTPSAAGTRVLATWFDDGRQNSGYGAVLGSSNVVVLTHVLLPDDLPNKRRMLVALAGRLAPDLWREAAAASLAHIGALSEFTSFEQASAAIRETGPKNPRVRSALDDAGHARAAAEKAFAEGRFAATRDQAAEARDQLTRAFCLAQPSSPGEFRAFWCHSAFGVDGIDWDTAVRRLAENGFTAILPNMLWGGVAYYESSVLPVAPAVAERGDQITQCLAACRKYGLQVHVWKVNWNLGRAVPREFVARMRADGRLQANYLGKEEPWLCPSHPDNQKLEVDSMVEIVRRYGVDGIHFDYIRYPDGEHCFCAGCRARFAKSTGTSIQRWPQDAMKGGPAHDGWLEWRRSNITAVVKAVSEQARAVRPTIKLSAAVFPNWTADRDGVGQDWKLWCERGYMDFVCPMDYTTSNRRFRNLVEQQVQWAGKVPCYPGIGLSASTSEFGVDRVIDQIRITRQFGTRGFTIFNYGVPESAEILPMLGQGITARGGRIAAE